MSSKASSLARPECLFIDGHWVEPSSSRQIHVLNSSTEEPYLSVAEASEADVHEAVAAARRAFDDGPWPLMSHKERAAFLMAISEELSLRAGDIANSWTIESGITHKISEPLSKTVGPIYAYYAAMAETFLFVEERQTTTGKGAGYLVREPVGVVAAIIPWNGPPLILNYKVAPALLAGCTMVIKPAPEAPSAAYILAEVCEKVGLPPGVINVLTAEREVSESLVRNPGVDKVTFTGSTVAGRRIASICGDRVARCTLELGGKSAGIVCEDYDVETAAKAIAGKALFLTGQVCASLTRIIVPKKRHDALVSALCAEFSNVSVGDPFDAAIDMGPLAMKRQLERVEGYIAKGKDEGAQLATGGGRPSHLNRGYFIEPTVFGNVSNQSTIAQEEIFGPVLSIIPAEDEDEAVRIANDSIYGLNSAVFTNDADRAYAIARRLRSGTVGHNEYRTDWRIAFGGFKQSGIGREGGEEGLFPFLETKTVLLDAAAANA